MRDRLEWIWRSGKWVEALALIAGAVVVLVAVRALGDSGRPHERGATRESRPRNRSSLVLPESPTGAAEAATLYLALLSEVVDGDSASARAELSAMTAGSMRPLQQRLPALADALQARLASTGAPAAFDGWPLGYRVTSFNAPGATVLVWHLDLAASSALPLMTVDYATTTYQVRWVGGTWRIVHASSVDGPTPPSSDASTATVDRFAAAVRQFSGYRYVP